MAPSNDLALVRALSESRTAQQTISTETNQSTQVLADDVTPVPVSQPGLTAFEESASSTKVSAVHDTRIERFISNPFPISSPTELLQRTFQVATISWTNVYAGQVIQFPGAFSTIQTLLDVFKKFFWFRASVHIEIKLQSTPYHQGSLMVGWLPCAGSAAPDDLQLVSGYDGTVLSASVQDTCSFDIPYLHPADWISTTITPSTNGDLCSLFITPLNTLLTSSPGIAAVVPVLVFASFKNIEVTGYVSQSRPGPRFAKNTEAEDKVKNGVDSKAVVSAGSKLLRQIPLVGSIYSPIADAINSFAGDLSKPVNSSAICPNTMPYYRDVNQGAGLTDATPLSLYPNPVLNQAPTMFGMETSHLTISKLSQRPLLYDQVTFNGTTVNWEVAVHPLTLGATVTGRDYLASMSTCHRYWRGSIKYLFHFCMPAFYSCRVRFSLDFMGGSTPDSYGDLMTRFVDIKGDTWEEVTVPYLHHTTWSDTQVTSFPPFLRLFQVTSIVGSSDPATPVMYVNVFRAGGEDMEFAGLADINTLGEGVQLKHTNALIKDRKADFENQTNIGARFQKQFPGINKGETQSREKGLCMVEVSGTVSDCVKRHQALTNSTTLPNGAAPLNGTMLYLSRFFWFWRGGRIFRHVHYDQNSATPSGFFLQMGTSNALCNGWAPSWYQAANLVQPEAVQVPYYSAQPYYPVISQSSFYLEPTCYISPPVDCARVNGTASNGPMTLAGADDFVLLHVVPIGNSTPVASAALKTRGLITTALLGGGSRPSLMGKERSVANEPTPVRRPEKGAPF